MLLIYIIQTILLMKSRNNYQERIKNWDWERNDKEFYNNFKK